MARSEIVAVLARAADYYGAELEDMRREALARGDDPDWPWKGLVVSAATRGGSWRWDSVVEPIYDERLSWSALEKTDERSEAFLSVGRFKNRTAASLEKLYQFIKSEGGPAGVRKRLRPLDANQVLAFWQARQEIGDKYARNMMLDIHDSRFRNGFFAVDSRIDQALPLLGYHGRSSSYAEKEQFLDRLAAQLGLDGWTLDRLIYNWAHDIREKIRLSSKSAADSAPRVGSA